MKRLILAILMTSSVGQAAVDISNLNMQEPITCANVFDKMLALDRATSAQGDDVIYVASNLADVLDSWYGQFQALEGSTVHFAPGAFDKVQVAASTAHGNVAIFTQQFDSIRTFSQAILAKLPQCLKANARSK